MSALTSWAYLSRVIEGPNQHLQALLRAGRDADEIANGVRTRASWLGGLAGATEARYARAVPEEDLAKAADLGFSLITPDSPNWPSTAISASFDTLTALEKGACPPHALWVKGQQNLPALFAQSVGVVGTRAPSHEGQKATANLVAGLAKHQYTIVSGGAAGVDTVAHDTALANATPTVVITAFGAGVTYPRPNERLFQRVTSQGGAMISEYPPGVTPDRHRFLTRNRLIAALSQGSVVVEAGYRSGALNTLNWLHTFNRQAMAVPGSIMEKACLGTNLAIAKEQATMVLSADHIHELLSTVGEEDMQLKLDDLYEPTPIQRLSRNELQVYDSLPLPSVGARTAEQVAEVAGMAVGLTVHLLMELESRNLVRRERRLWRRVELDKK